MFYFLAMAIIILAYGWLVPEYMYKHDINRVRTRYWGKNRTWLKTAMKYNRIVSIVGGGVFLALFIKSIL